MAMATLAIFRSMHNVRPGEQHRPSREVELTREALSYYRLCDLEVPSAWSTDRLTEIRRRMESEAKLLESYAKEAECRALGRAQVDDEVREKLRARLATDARYLAATQFVELARDAEARMMTLVLAE
jgi:hypothetical protein